MQPFDVLLDGINQLGLILLNSTTNLRKILDGLQMPQIWYSYLWADKQRVELREHAEHLVRVASRPQSVAESCDDLVLHACDALIVGVFSSDPDLAALYNTL